MNKRGLTLIELLLAMAIGSVVAMAAYTVFVSSNWSAREQEDFAEAQQNVRVGMDRLIRDIRTAGFGLPEPPFSLTIDGTSFSSPVVVDNSGTGPDTITLLGIGERAGLLNRDGTSPPICNAPGTQLLCLESGDDGINRFKKTDGTFNPKRIYVSLGGIEAIELQSSGQDRMGETPPKLKTVDILSGDYANADNIPIYILQAVQYSIVNDGSVEGCTAQYPCLASRDFTDLRGSGRRAVAEGIEDIQFAYGLDVNPRDARVDAGTDGAAAYGAGDFVDNPGDPESIIAVRANIVARTRTPDPQGTTHNRECLEDRAADTGCTGASDTFQRRALTNVIKLRNPRTGT